MLTKIAKNFAKPNAHTIFWYCIVVFGLPQATASEDCTPIAETALERCFCEVLAKGSGEQLPAFSEFRKNSESIQRLLLKKPARKAGVKLPDKRKAPSTATAKKLPAAESTSRDVHAISASVSPTQSPAQAEQTSQLTVSLPQRCQLNKATLSCANHKYVLQENLKLHELAANALNKNNQLRFVSRNGFATESAYLTACYQDYIKRLLSIGLGAATMPYSRFVEVHNVSPDNFEQRFSEVFELLKQERKSQAIQRRYGNAFPATIAACMDLSSDLIVCDNLKQNWVYKRAKN